LEGGAFTSYEYSALPLILITTAGAFHSMFQLIETKFHSPAESQSWGVEQH
jgi:hypothetical protein